MATPTNSTSGEWISANKRQNPYSLKKTKKQQPINVNKIFYPPSQKRQPMLPFPPSGDKLSLKQTKLKKFFKNHTTYSNEDTIPTKTKSFCEFYSKNKGSPEEDSTSGYRKSKSHPTNIQSKADFETSDLIQSPIGVEKYTSNKDESINITRKLENVTNLSDLECSKKPRFLLQQSTKSSSTHCQSTSDSQPFNILDVLQGDKETKTAFDKQVSEVTEVEAHVSFVGDQTSSLNDKHSWTTSDSNGKDPNYLDIGYISQLKNRATDNVIISETESEKAKLLLTNTLGLVSDSACFDDSPHSDYETDTLSMLPFPSPVKICHFYQNDTYGYLMCCLFPFNVLYLVDRLQSETIQRLLLRPLLPLQVGVGATPIPVSYSLC